MGRPIQGLNAHVPRQAQRAIRTGGAAGPVIPRRVNLGRMSERNPEALSTPARLDPGAGPAAPPKMAAQTEGAKC